MKICYSWKIHPPPHTTPLFSSAVLASICSPYFRRRRRRNTARILFVALLFRDHLKPTKPTLSLCWFLPEYKEAWLPAPIVSFFLFTRSGLCFSLASVGSLAGLGLQLTPLHTHQSPITQIDPVHWFTMVWLFLTFLTHFVIFFFFFLNHWIMSPPSGGTQLVHRQRLQRSVG